MVSKQNYNIHRKSKVFSRTMKIDVGDLSPNRIMEKKELRQKEK